ncbi:hypothetical protein [Brevundimonas sp.]|jgi:hypothetical protein|uniref:hypothetical protein n=1 Tax=Brevundimonas sp. TaxID=1871086 RepID=UPI0037BE3A7B
MPKAFIVTRGAAPVQYWTPEGLWTVSRRDAARFQTLAALEAAAERLADLGEISVALMDPSEEANDPA